MENNRLSIKEFKNKFDDIIRDGRDINFTDIKTEIELLITFFDIYFSSNFIQKHFSDSQRQDIENYCYQPFVESIHQILETTNWSVGSDQSIRSNITQAYNRLLQQGYLSTAEAAKTLDDNFTENVLKEFKEKSNSLIAEQEASAAASKQAVTDTIEQLTTQQADVDKKIKQIEAKAEKSAKSLAKQVSSESGTVFLDDAKKYADIAKRWLIALVVVSFLAAVVLAWLFVELSVSKELFADNLLFTGLKATTLLFLIYLIQIANKNYNANKHLQTINKQRASVLAFINTFVNSVDGDEYKDYLLTYAAKTVFEHGESGFISRNYGAGSGDSDGLDSILSSMSKIHK